MDTEVKSAVEDVKKSFEEYKKVNDQRIEALKAGRSTSEYDEKLEKLNAAIDASEKKQSEYLKRIAMAEEKSRALEAMVNRIAMGGSGAEGASESKAKSQVFEAWARRGLERLSADEAKTLIVANDSTGGYLAPPQLLMEIIKAEVLYSPMRSIVTVQRIGGSEFQQPKRTQTAAATRVGETQSRTETQNPAWGMVKIDAPEMYAEARASLQNLEDSAFNLEQLLTDEFAEQFGVKEGAEVISGNGVNQCLGFLDANAAGPSTPIAYTASGTSGSLGSSPDALIDLQHAVKTAYAVRGSWLLNRSTLGAVRKMKDSNGQYIWAPGLAGAVPATILNAPYTECPDMPDVAANSFPIAFGDWKRAYTLVDRVDIAVTRDPYTLASVGQVKFTARKRVGGKVVLGEAIRLLKCA